MEGCIRVGPIIYGNASKSIMMEKLKAQKADAHLF